MTKRYESDMSSALARAAETGGKAIYDGRGFVVVAESTVTDGTEILIHEDPANPHRCTWADFIVANVSTALDDPDWLPTVRRNLEETGEHREGVGGGGFTRITLACDEATGCGCDGSYQCQACAEDDRGIA